MFGITEEVAVFFQQQIRELGANRKVSELNRLTFVVAQSLSADSVPARSIAGTGRTRFFANFASCRCDQGKYFRRFFGSDNGVVHEPVEENTRLGPTSE